MPVNVDVLLDNPLLHFTTPTSVRTGEIYEERPMVAKYQGFTIIIKTDSRGKRFAKMDGSIHKYGNKGKHNHDQYDFIRMASDINGLCKILKINPHEAVLNGLEFGVNIEIPHSPDKFLYNVIDHKGEKFNQSRDHDKYYIEAKHKNYRIKLYNKSKQNSLPSNLLRIEIHCNRMHHLKKVDITTLGDLLDKEKLQLLGQQLSSHFHDLLINDKITNNELIKERDKTILLYGTSHYYWDELRKDQPYNYPKKRKRFTELIDRYGDNNFRDVIGGLIKKTWSKLLFKEAKAVQESNILEMHYFTGINNWYSRLMQVKESQSPRKHCVITGCDITHQQEESKFISEGTIRLIYYINKILFTQKFKKYAPSINNYKSADELCYLIAHNIRNADSNPRNFKLRNAMKNQIEHQYQHKLFDTIVDSFDMVS